MEMFTLRPFTFHIHIKISIASTNILSIVHKTSKYCSIFSRSGFKIDPQEAQCFEEAGKRFAEFS